MSKQGGCEPDRAYSALCTLRGLGVWAGHEGTGADRLGRVGWLKEKWRQSFTRGFKINNKYLFSVSMSYGAEDAVQCLSSMLKALGSILSTRPKKN